MFELYNVPGLLRQTIASITVCLATLCSGLSYGWTSTMIPHLQQENYTLDMEVLTDEQQSWLTSALSLSPFFILFFCGTICEKFGRKPTSVLIALPFILCWLLRLFATNFYHIFAAQMFSGMGDAFIFFFGPLYITEITSVNVRGFLTSFVLFSFKIGLLLGYICGAILSYRVYAIVGLIVPIVYLAGVLWLPESPVWLVRHYRLDEAKKSLMWLRRNAKSIVDFELSRLHESYNEKVHIRMLTRIRVLSRDRGVIKGMFIGIIMTLGQQLAGINIVLLYTVTIFDLAKSSVDPYIATIVAGVMQVFGVGLSTFIIERTGRRPLVFISSGGVMICYILLASFLMAQDPDESVPAAGWIPMVTISLVGVFYSIGVGPMSYIVPNEVYHPDVASFCYTIALFALYISGFMISKFFPSLSNLIGLHYCFFILVLCCLCIVLLVYFLVPETKGRTREAIIDELRWGKRESRAVLKEVNVESIG